jgi:serine/threonine protein kinase/HAMP domain-containing protein
MSRTEGLSQATPVPASPSPPSVADDTSAAGAVAFDPDATCIAPAAEPLAEMPTITAANSMAAYPPTVHLPGPPGARGGALQQPPEKTVTETLPGVGVGKEVTVRQVGRYEVMERLGRGGMASVFKAHDPGIARDVAIKFLHASLCEDEEYRARFLREARAAGGLSHPNIVTVHDVGEIDGRPYMAMELLDGESLAEVLEPGQPLPVRDVVVMGIQLARALAYAHQRGIVHRDIKPGNISRQRGTLDIKVMDFGIAHMESTKSEQRTRVGDVLGTPQYMSPEQTQGEKIDGRSDLFSAGIVLYQMLTGQRPFNGQSVVTLAVQIAKEEPPAIEKLRPGLPASLRRVVERCLAKSPERRFQSGAELADALVRVLGEIDEEAREASKPRIMPLRVKWAATMALIVAVVMAITASVIIQRQYAALMGQVSEYGAALSRFIAAQNAVSALAEDWVSIDVSLQEVMKTRDFESVTVTDRGGVVRASSNASALGKPYQAPAGEVLGNEGGVKRSRYRAQDEAVLGFESPITFQGKQVGRVALGLPERPLERVARLSMMLMGVLALVTVLAVAIAMYFVANWFARPIKRLGQAMDEIAHGRFDFRIHEQRKDEFGLLYEAFDRAAQSLQDRFSGAAPVAPLAPVAPVVEAAKLTAAP